MQIGVFAKTFARSSVSDAFAAVRESGCSCTQFNMSCAGLPSMPDGVADAVADSVRQAATANRVDVAAVSGTYNMIHPDPAERRRGLSRLTALMRCANRLGTRVITLCTGTMDPDDQWRGHPENDSPEAWATLIAELERALAEAERTGVVLAFEPELANVINTAEKGARLIEELGSSNLKVVIDPANLFETATKSEQERIVGDALDLLGPHIVIAHAKDRRPDGAFAVAGQGVLDYDGYLAGLARIGFDGSLVLHGLDEGDVPDAVRFLYQRLEARS